MNASFDIAAIRREFPIIQRILFFDSAHQAPLSCVKAALERFFTEGLETAGRKSRWLARVEDIRARLAQLIGADPSEIAFTKNTSEGLNIAANALPLTAGDNVLLVEGDHHNNFLNLRAKGINVRFLAMGEEAFDAASFAPHIDACTRAVSLSHVTFHAGHVSNITGIGRLCEKRIHLTPRHPRARRRARPDRTGGPCQHNPPHPGPRRPPACPSRRDGHRYRWTARTHILVLDLPVAARLRYLESENVRVSPERGGIRVSFAMFNTPGDVDRLARINAKGRAAKIGCAEQSPKSQPSEAR
jgi:selenocysteine lyase/cysteine desulfurase